MLCSLSRDRCVDVHPFNCSCTPTGLDQVCLGLSWMVFKWNWENSSNRFVMVLKSLSHHCVRYQTLDMYIQVPAWHLHLNTSSPTAWTLSPKPTAPATLSITAIGNYILSDFSSVTLESSMTLLFLSHLTTKASRTSVFKIVWELHFSSLPLLSWYKALSCLAALLSGETDHIPFSHSVIHAPCFIQNQENAPVTLFSPSLHWSSSSLHSVFPPLPAFLLPQSLCITGSLCQECFSSK